jgi:hypothetical protein
MAAKQSDNGGDYGDSGSAPRGGDGIAHGGIRVDRDLLQRLARLPQPKTLLSLPEFEARREEFRHRVGRLSDDFQPPVLKDERPVQTPQPRVSWKALTADGDFCADTQIAVSRTHVVVTTRTHVGIFDRAGAALQPPIYVGDLFAPLDLKSQFDIETYFDTRAIFDPHRQRFWIGCLAVKFLGGAHTDHRTKFACAVSVSDNPLDGFHLYWWDAVAHDGVANDAVFKPGDWGDYPTLGVDVRCIYQTNHVANAVDPAIPNRYTHLMLLPADDLAAGKPGPIAGWQFWDLTEPDGTTPVNILQAAVHRGQSLRAYFAANILWPDRLLLFGLRDPLGPTQLMERATVKLGAFGGTVNGTQKGSTDPIEFTNVANNPLKAAVLNNRIVLSMNDAAPWDIGGGQLSTCRIIDLDLSRWPGVVLNRIRVFGSHNVLEDGPNDRFHYGWPAAELNQRGDLVVVYSRTGATIFPEIRFSLWADGEADIRPSRLLKGGEAAYTLGKDQPNPLPWADVAGVSVDPDGEHVWFAHCYADLPSRFNNFSTWVGRM